MNSTVKYMKTSWGWAVPSSGQAMLVEQTEQVHLTAGTELVFLGLFGSGRLGSETVILELTQLMFRWTCQLELSLATTRGCGCSKLRLSWAEITYLRIRCYENWLLFKFLAQLGIVGWDWVSDYFTWMLCSPSAMLCSPSATLCSPSAMLWSTYAMMCCPYAGETENKDNSAQAENNINYDKLDYF
jgi:hypothetical protein